MHPDRRTFIRCSTYLCAVAAFEPLTLSSQAIPHDELDVIATVLRAQCSKDEKHPLLIASERFSTGRMIVLTSQPTPIQKAMHKVELPYLLPPAERMTEAEELADAYNSSLERTALPLYESAVSTFKHRLLDDKAVSQFQALSMDGNVYSDEIEAQKRAVPSHYRRYFAGSTTLWTISRVAFGSGGALAVVGIRSSGGNCTTERWEILEHSQGTWHGRNWGGGVMTCA